MTNFDALLAGYRRFRETGWSAQRERWAELAEGQSPKLMVIACSDSRTDPSLIFDTAPGEMFVVRNVANLVPPFETDGSRHGVSAALEFAVKVLQVEEIVVLGHGFCGGCAAALTRQFTGLPPGEGGFIAHWIDLLDDARDKVLAEHRKPLERDAFRAMEHAAVKVSLTNLRSFPCIPESEANGSLRLRGAFFSISEGVLHLLDEFDRALRTGLTAAAEADKHGCETKEGEREMPIDRMGLDWAPRLLSVLRIVSALIFFAHGTQKLLGFPASDMRPEMWSLSWIAGLMELVGGALLLLGLWTRPVAFVLAGEMAVAYWYAHAPQSPFPALNGGDAAILYCFVFLYIAAAGPGPWSIDAMRNRSAA